MKLSEFIDQEVLSDPAWRASFLENVPDNARILDLASAWLPAR